MGLVCHLSVVTPWYTIHRKGYLMLHHLALAGATIQVANLIDYNCHPLEDGNETCAKCTCFIQSAHVSYKVHMFHTKCTCFIQSAHVSFSIRFMRLHTVEIEKKKKQIGICFASTLILEVAPACDEQHMAFFLSIGPTKDCHVTFS